MATSTTTPAAPIVERLAPNVYRVPSRSNGRDHIITIYSTGPSCTCEAGDRGVTCWASRIVAAHHPAIAAAELAEKTAAASSVDIWDV